LRIENDGDEFGDGKKGRGDLILKGGIEGAYKMWPNLAIC
jgi:hypothetical protein